MDRRQFLQSASAAAMASLSPRLLAADQSLPQRFQLSVDGCGRATAYAETNKIVTIGDKTHVVWLDSVAEGFRARIRTLDRKSGEWSSTFTLGKAFDNHGGPALTADSRGFLHVVYHPHHHPFRYRKSKRPNDATDWEEEILFGERLTYPTLVCGPDDTLYMTSRRSYSDQAWQVELWSKPAAGDWQGPTIIAKSRYRGYSHFQESLAWSPDHRLLHLSCRFHENSDRSAYGRLQTVGYMVSNDFGTTWRRSDGSLIQMPATAESIEALDSGGVDSGRILRAGALAVDAHGTPHVVCSFSKGDRSETILASPRADGRWQRRELSAFLPDNWKQWQLGMPGGLTFDCRGEMTVTGTIQRVGEGEEGWGHASSEVVFLTSADRGETFSFELASQLDPRTAHWLPNIERPTGHNAVSGRPGLIYTAGPPGEKNTDILSNGVLWLG